MKLAQINHKVHTLEENLITAKERAKFAERNLSESEKRVENAENNLCFFREETKKMKRQLYICSEENRLEKMKLEEKAVAAECKVSVTEKTTNEIRGELVRMTNMTIKAKKEHADVTERARLLEAELRKFLKSDQRAKEELTHAQMKFNSQKEDLVKRANHAEEKLVNVKKTMQVAQAKIQVFEQKITKVESTLCNVKAEADKEIAELQQKLSHSTKRAESAETDLYMYHKKFKVADRELHDRVKMAEEGMLVLSQAKCHTENVLKEALQQAKRESHEATAKLHQVVKVLASGKESSEHKLEESPQSIPEVQKLLTSTKSNGIKAETIPTRAEKNKHSHPTNSKDELSKLESILNGCMESTKAHFTAQTTKQKEASRKKTRPNNVVRTCIITCIVWFTAWKCHFLNPP